MTQAAWQSRLTAVVAGQIRRYRRARRLSAQQISDRCAELGLEVPRHTVADLENGRRANITLAELVVLAQVLDVSPTLLIVPVETEPTMEILPGRKAATKDVLEWFAGEARFILAGDSGLEAEYFLWPDKEGPTNLIHLYRYHSMVVSFLMSQIDLGQDIHADDDGGADMDGGPGELRLTRRVMRKQGARLPELPPELRFVDDEGDPNRIRHAVRRA